MWADGSGEGGRGGAGPWVEGLPVLRGKHGADLNLAVTFDAVPHTVLRWGSRQSHHHIDPSWARGTLALDRYSAGATLQALKVAVTDLQAMSIPSDVAAAQAETQNQ